MGNNSKVLEYILRLKDEASREAGKVAGNIQNSMKSAEKGSFALLGAVTAVSAATVAYGYKAVEAYNIQAEAEAKLTQLHKNREGVTDDHVKQLMELASAVQSYGVIGDEAVITGQAQLATFQLSTDAIKKLTPAMADMVAHNAGVNATGGDFVNIGNLMGKVMEGNIGALGRYGVSFSDAQEEILKTGNETERAAALAEVLQQNYGGVNEALRDTFEGSMQAARNTIGDFNEIVGENISNYIRPAIEAFNDWTEAIGGPEGMMRLLNEQFAKIQEWLPIIIGGLLGGLFPALAVIATGIWLIMAPLIPWIAAGAALVGVTMLIIEALGGWDEIQMKVQDTLNILNAFYVEHLEPSLNRFWQVLQEELMPALENVWSTIKDQLWPQLKRLWDLVSPVLIPVLKFLALVLGSILVQGTKMAIDTFSTLVTWISRAINWVNDFVSYIVGIPDRIRGALEEAGGLLQKLNPFHRNSPSLVDNVLSGVKLIRKEYESLQQMSLPTLSREFSPALVGNQSGFANQNNYTTQAPITVNATINNEMSAQELAGLIGLEIEMRSRF